MLHRDEEDALYRQFSQTRAEEALHINSQIKEEWEKELEKLTSRFHHEMSTRRKKISMDEERALTLRHQRDKEDLEKNMTIKLDRKKESLTKKLLEQERQATAELVEKQSKEMMNLITEKLHEFSISRNHSSSNGTNGTNGKQNGLSDTKDSRNHVSIYECSYLKTFDINWILYSFSIQMVRLTILTARVRHRTRPITTQPRIPVIHLLQWCRPFPSSTSTPIRTSLRSSIRLPSM